MNNKLINTIIYCNNCEKNATFIHFITFKKCKNLYLDQIKELEKIFNKNLSLKEN